jgi:hypothetical protein
VSGERNPQRRPPLNRSVAKPPPAVVLLKPMMLHNVADRAAAMTA